MAFDVLHLHNNQEQWCIEQINQKGNWSIDDSSNNDAEKQMGWDLGDKRT